VSDPLSLDEIRKLFQEAQEEIKDLREGWKKAILQTKINLLPETEAAVHIEELEQEITRLRAALKFYGAAVNYEREMGMRPASPIQLDKGKIARAALGSK